MDAQHEASAQPRYVAAPAEALRIVPLDALTAIYHRASGITHLVESPVPELIALLRAPLTVAALMERLETEFDLLDPDPAALADRLAELETIGLVARA